MQLTGVGNNRDVFGDRTKLHLNVQRDGGSCCHGDAFLRVFLQARCFRAHRVTSRRKVGHGIQAGVGARRGNGQTRIHVSCGYGGSRERGPARVRYRSPDIARVRLPPKRKRNKATRQTAHKT